MTLTMDILKIVNQTNEKELVEHPSLLEDGSLFSEVITCQSKK